MSRTTPSRSPTRRRDRGHRRALAWGLATSAVLHAAALFLSPSASVPGAGAPRDEARPDPRPPGLRTVDVRVAERSPATEAPPATTLEVPTPSRPAVTLGRLEPVPVRDVSARWRAAATTGARGSADGPPSAGGSGGGSGGFTPPVPRSLLPDWSPPPEVRGHRVTVRVEVDPRGRPTGRVDLVPPTPSEDFNRRLRERMARLEFLPARRDGRPVRAWAEITFTF